MRRLDGHLVQIPPRAVRRPPERHIPLSNISNFKLVVKHPKRNEPSSSRGESYSPTVIHPVHAVLDESENQFESIEGRFEHFPEFLKNEKCINHKKFRNWNFQMMNLVITC